MSTRIHLLASALVVLAAACASVTSLAAAAAPGPRPATGAKSAGGPYVPGEAIVHFESGATAGERAAARGGAGVEFARSLRIPQAQLVELDGGVEAAVRRLERQPDVAYAQPNYRYEALVAPPGWSTTAFNGGTEWGLSNIAATGSHSAADSPVGGYGNASDPELWSESRLVRDAGADLSNQRGCRMHFSARYALETDFDFLEVGAVTPAGFPSLVSSDLTGSTGGSFFREEVSISAHDGAPDVRPWFALLADESVTDDGAYVDDVRVICRDQTYVDAIAPGSTYDQAGSGNYVRFNGTSMAAPHVAGTAALVRAAVPSATDTHVIAAIKAGGAPLPSLVGTTVTGCTTDALGAIQAAQGSPPPFCTAATGTAEPPPNDTFFASLWGLQDSSAPSPGVNALRAWAVEDSEGEGAGQVIAIVDTGVDLTHPDLQGNLWTSLAGHHGYDFVDDDPIPDDYGFHGTHVAGTAAAVAGNGLGIAGVAPDAEIMAVRALDGNGSGSSADIGDGIAFAAQNGADVINLSLGAPGAFDQNMSDAIDAANGQDAVVVAAAGNDGTNNDLEPTVPCNLPQPNIICVAAVNESGDRAGFSNFGATSVDVGAPGTNILSAKTDYGEALLADGFEPAGLPPGPPAPMPPPTVPPSPLAPTAPAPRALAPTAPAPTAPAKPRLASAGMRARVSRRGVFRYSLRATPGLTGTARFRTRRKVVVSRKARVTVAVRRFSVGRTGKVTLTIKLSKRKLRILRRNRKLSLAVVVRVRNATGLSSSASRRLTLLAPKR